MSADRNAADFSPLLYSLHYKFVSYFGEVALHNIHCSSSPCPSNGIKSTVLEGVAAVQ